MTNFLGSGNFYPHLFCYDISNFHGNKRFGQIYKRNFYTSLVDLLEGNKSNRPINCMGIASSLIEILSESDPVSVTVEIGKLIILSNNQRQRLLNVLNAARSREAAVRGEVRIDFEHLASHGTLLNEQLNASNLVDKLVVISTDTIVDLITCYLLMLFDPIIFNLGKLNNDLKSRDTKSFNSIITTITAFESLLYFTLFSGTTHSYVRKLIWATGQNAHRESFKLMDSLKSLNHPVFSSSLWDIGNLRIVNMDNEIMEDMMLGLGGKSKLNVEAIKLMLAVMNEGMSPLELAIMLWTSYYNEIPSTDFGEPDLPRWKLISLNDRTIRFTAYTITVKEAALKIFDTRNLNSIAWKKPYLRAYKFWTDRGSVNDTFEWILKAATEVLRIEVVRYHCGASRFFATGHLYQKIQTNRDIPIANRQAFHAISESIHESVAAAEKNTLSGVRRGRGITFEQKEDIDLIRGYNSFFRSSSTWMDIKTCAHLCFANSVLPRDNVSLKDRFRNLKLKRLIVPDPMNSERYLIPGFEEICRRPVERTRSIGNQNSNSTVSR